MNGFDYIRIRGFETSAGTGGTIDPGLFEIFQGVSTSFEAGDVNVPGDEPSVTLPLPITPICEDEALAEGIWQGQNEKLQHENEYCDQLQKLFKRKEERVNGVKDKLFDIVEEVIGNGLAKLVAGWVFVNTGSLELAWLANLITEVGVEWGIEGLLGMLTRGNQLLDGIKAENDKLLEVEKSRENYEYREAALARHREDIKIILEQIRLAEKSVEINTQLEMKALLERLTDLAFQDTLVQTGDMIVHNRGKVVDFG